MTLVLRTLLFLGLSGLASAAPLPFTPSSVPGGIAAVALPDGPARPSVRYGDNPVMVQRFDDRWYAIVGVPLSAKAGTDYLVSAGKRIPFTISDKRYNEQHIKLANKRQVNPNPEDEARIARESQLMQPAWRTWDGEHVPDLRLAQPTPGTLTSSFGSRRFFNGEARAPHSGLDIAAPQGAEVRAPAEGTVVLTGNFFFNGNSVFLAHGQGMVSMYCHLDQIAVKAGQRVKTGDLLGLVGKTGRATGPHLHWSLSLNNARVDPRLLLPKPDGEQP